ncbi:MAG: RHS repeat-associated core domain-containing protein, partial [Bacteroidota bacterium]
TLGYLSPDQFERQHTADSSFTSLRKRGNIIVYSYRGLLRRIGDGNLDWMSTEVRYRYSPSGEREQKRVTSSYASDAVKPYPWVYYLLGGNNQQLAVYHGQQKSNTTCSDTGRRVYMYPFEYLTYGNGTASNFTTRADGTKEYRIADQLGSTRVGLTSSGVDARYNYEAFGKQIPITGAYTPREGYIGKEKDIESQTFDFGVRKYDDETGRFLSLDPLWEKYRGFTPYHYSGNNPVSGSDGNGDSIEITRLVNPKGGDPTGGGGASKMIGELETVTGLKLQRVVVGEKIFLEIDRNQPITGGSQTARDLLSQIINDKCERITLSLNNDFGTQTFGHAITFNSFEMDWLEQGACDVEPLTMGWGMTFFHEWFHSYDGGLYKHLSLYDPEAPLDITDQVPNTIRRELGPTWGQRLTYAFYFLGSGWFYLPFTGAAQNAFRQGYGKKVTGGGYVRYPKNSKLR